MKQDRMSYIDARALDRLQDFLKDIATGSDADLDGVYYMYRKLTDKVFLRRNPGSICPSVDRKLVHRALVDIEQGHTFYLPMPRLPGSRPWTGPEALSLALGDSFAMQCSVYLEGDTVVDAVEYMVTDFATWLAKRALVA